MNRLQGHIVDIDVSGNLSVVTVAVDNNIRLKAIVIETPETAEYLRKDRQILLLFKETEVIIGTGKNFKVSVLNRIAGKIRNIEKGRLLSRVVLETAGGEITAIIGSHAVDLLRLKRDLDVTAMIKLNEVMLKEI